MTAGRPTYRERLHRLAASPGVWTLLSAVIFALRTPDAWSPPQLWAEDAVIFLAGALGDPLGSIVEPYAGYLHLIPRILALSALGVPLASVPAVYAGLAFLGTVAAMAYAATARMPVPAWQVSALALAVVPHNGEVAFTITNLQWMTATCLALAAAAPPAESRGRRRLDLTVVGLCGLTGPFSILFLPAFVLRAWASWSSGQARALLALAAATASVQLALLAATGALGGAPTVLPDAGTVAYLVLGKGLGEWFAFDPRPPVPWGAVVAVGLVVATAGSLCRSGSRLPIVALGLCGAAILASAIVKWSGDSQTLLRLAPHDLGSRYFYTSGVLLAWILWIAAWDGWRVCRYAAWLALLLLVANSAWHTKRVPRPDQGWAEQVRRFEAGGGAVLRILPEGWTVTLPSRVRPR